MTGYGSSGLEGAPILCKRCGAPTDPQPDLSVRCRHCGTPDRLPPDELGRALEIRGRLTLAAGRVAQLAGTESALASIFEKSFPLALLVGRISYGRKVRPLLAARPPFQPGAPMRCRACGGTSGSSDSGWSRASR